MFGNRGAKIGDFGGLWVGFFGFWVTHRPCHACAGRCGGLGSMAALFLSAGVHTACLRNCCRPFGAVFSGHVIPTLASGRLGIYGCGMLVLFFCRQGFTPPASAIAVAPSGLFSAAMSCRRWHVRGRASMAAVCWCCFALFPTNNIISPTKTLRRQTYFTVIHYILYLFVFVLNNRNALYL